MSGDAVTGPAVLAETEERDGALETAAVIALIEKRLAQLPSPQPAVAVPLPFLPGIVARKRVEQAYRATGWLRVRFTRAAGQVTVELDVLAEHRLGGRST